MLVLIRYQNLKLKWQMGTVNKHLVAIFTGLDGDSIFSECFHAISQQWDFISIAWYPPYVCLQNYLKVNLNHVTYFHFCYYFLKIIYFMLTISLMFT